MLLDRLFAAVVLLISFSSGQSLQCHEGFNVSLSGIPFYFWHQHDCTKDSECFMQEISYGSPETTLLDVVLRYGGCVSKTLARYMSCEELYGEDSNVTVDTAFDIIRGLEQRRPIFIDDIIENAASVGRFFSRGNGPEEFVFALLDFLESIGYKRSKLEQPLWDVYRSFDDDSQMLQDKMLALIEAAQVRNDATDLLSEALQDFLRKSLDRNLPSFDATMRYVSVWPGFVYPVLTQYFGTGFDEIYKAVATGLQNIESEGKEVKVSEKYQKAFFASLKITLLLISRFDPTAVHEPYEVIKNIVEGYQSQGDPQLIDDSLEHIMIISYYAEEIAYLPSCKTDDDMCELENILQRLKIEQNRNRELYQIFTRSIPVDLDLTSGVQRRSKLVSVFFDEMREQWTKLDQEEGKLYHLLTDTFDKFKRVVEKTLLKLGKRWKEIRKALSPDSCNHLTCTTVGCNSHSAFKSKKEFRRMSKEEL